MADHRSYIAFLLAVTVALNMLAMPLSYVSFRLNQDYYATVLCENPQEPITVCGGICFLKKQLPTSDEGQASFASKIDISVYFHAVTPWAPRLLASCSPQYAPYRVLAPRAAPDVPFHPPQG